MRYLSVVPLGFLALASDACADIRDEASAFFCRLGERPGTYRAFAAIRRIPDGDVQFAISGLQSNGHQFNLHGIAVRIGGEWVFKERPIKTIDIGHDVYVEEVDAMAEPSCKVTIQWNVRDRLAIHVDKNADCEAYAGAHFGEKSTEFETSDYVGPVRGELSGTSEDFIDTTRCDEPESGR